MVAKRRFASARCEQCDANLARRTPEDVQVIGPHPGEPGFEERLIAKCPSCGGYTSVMEVGEPEPPAESPEPSPKA